MRDSAGQPAFDSHRDDEGEQEKGLAWAAPGSRPATSATLVELPEHARPTETPGGLSNGTSYFNPPSEVEPPAPARRRDDSPLRRLRRAAEPTSEQVLLAHRSWEQCAWRQLKEPAFSQQEATDRRKRREDLRRELARTILAWASQLWRTHSATPAWSGSEDCSQFDEAWKQLGERQNEVEASWLELRRAPTDVERGAAYDDALGARLTALESLGQAGLGLLLAGSELLQERVHQAAAEKPEPQSSGGTHRPRREETRPPRQPEPRSAEAGERPRALDLHQMLDELGAEAEPETRSAWANQLAQLVSATSNGEMAVWTRYPAEIQRRLLELVAARARLLQTVARQLSFRDSDLLNPLDTVFRRINRFSQTERPGFAHGLSRNHKPRHDDWSEDASRLIEELRRLAGPRADRLEQQFAKLSHLAELKANSHRDKNLRKRVRSILAMGLAADDERLIAILRRVPEALVGDELSEVAAAVARATER